MFERYWKTIHRLSIGDNGKTIGNSITFVKNTSTKNKEKLNICYRDCTFSDLNEKRLFTELVVLVQTRETLKLLKVLLRSLN